MSLDVIMPRLSDSMTEGTVVNWLKRVGDEVSVGDELVEIETDKATMVYESDVAGTLLEILVADNETAPVGDVIARVGDPSKAVVADDEPAAPTAPAVSPDAEAEPERSSPRQPGSGAPGIRVKASPAARRMADAAGVDLTNVSGSGPGGRIVKADIERMLAPSSASAAGSPLSSEPPTAPNSGQAEPAKGATEHVELNRLQRSVARRMAESKATVPHFYLQAKVDMSRAFEARARLRGSISDGAALPSFNDMVVKACGLALREFPHVNGAYRDGRWELYGRVNVGVAVATPGSLVVPTIRDADRKSLHEIATEARTLVARVRDQSITPPELSGGTFTVSNLGMHGIANFHPVINPPQAAILAVGEIVEAPIARDGALATAREMNVTLACDHRILYGAEAAEFLNRVRTLLEEPTTLGL